MKTIKNQTAEFLLSEGNGSISRERLLIAPTAVDLESGTVLALPEGSDQYVLYEDGVDKPVASAILYAGLPVSTEVQRGVGIVRMAEVTEERLVGITDTAVASLEALNIIVRQ